MGDYYEKKDLENFPNIVQEAEEQGKKFFEHYSSAMDQGTLSKREKVLIALAVATVEKCPYCIDAKTNECLSLGITKKEMMEAIHVGAAMMAGMSLVHATQMKKIADKKEM